MDTRMTLDIEPLLDSEDVGRLLRMSARNVRNLRIRGILQDVRLPGTRGLRFKPATIRALLQEQDETTSAR